MTCKTFAEFLHRYFSGGLPQSEHDEFERHLERCPDCVNYLATYREARLLAHDALRFEEGSEETVPDRLVDAVMAIIEAR